MEDHTHITMQYSLAAIYIALTEAISQMFGKDIEPLANHLLLDMLPVMPPDAAEMCRCIAEFASSRASEDLPQSIDWERIIYQHDDASSARH